MSKIRTPKTTAAATALLERYAAIAGQVGLVQGVRSDAIAKANVAADLELQPLVTTLGEIRAALEPWWAEAKAELTKGKRKSAELGGCMVGSKIGRSTLEFSGGDDEAALVALQDVRWAKPYIRTKLSVDRVATLKALEEGRHVEGLKLLGFSKKEGADEFFVERVVQGGTMAS